MAATAQNKHTLPKWRKEGSTNSCEPCHTPHRRRHLGQAVAGVELAADAFYL
jgi:hypothetical protein